MSVSTPPSGRAHRRRSARGRCAGDRRPSAARGRPIAGLGRRWPWPRRRSGGGGQKDFIRGYGFQGSGGTRLNWGAPGFGNAYKQAIRQPIGFLNLGGFGETLARFENRIEIDPGGMVDAFGIPVVRIQMTWSDNELTMMKDMAATAAEMLDAAGATDIIPEVRTAVPGWGIHEVGVARMGSDPTTSVLNQYCQAHDVKNLFVMDGSCFVSIGCQNPTLTIMAITVRSTDYLMKQMKQGAV